MAAMWAYIHTYMHKAWSNRVEYNCIGMVCIIWNFCAGEHHPSDSQGRHVDTRGVCKVQEDGKKREKKVTREASRQCSNPSLSSHMYVPVRMVPATCTQKRCANCFWNEDTSFNCDSLSCPLGCSSSTALQQQYCNCVMSGQSFVVNWPEVCLVTFKHWAMLRTGNFQVFLLF